MKKKQSESSLQSSCVKWFRMQYPYVVIFAIPNGGSRNVMEAANLKRQGVLAGVSDLFIMAPASIDINGGKSETSIYVPNFRMFHGLFVEMKSGKNTTTPSQVEFLANAERCGYATAVCRSFEEFQETVKKYLHWHKNTHKEGKPNLMRSNLNGNRARLKDNPKVDT